MSGKGGGVRTGTLAFGMTPNEPEPAESGRSKVDPEQVGSKRYRKARVLEALSGAPSGLTVEETCLQLGMPHQSVSPRFVELFREGRIVRSGERPTTSGRPAAVYFKNAFWTP